MFCLQKSCDELSSCHEKNEKKRCPFCTSLRTKRNGFIKSSVKTIRGIVPRKTQRYFCLSCLKSFTSSVPNTRKHVSEHLKSLAVKEYITAKNSLSEVGRRFSVHGSSVNRWILKAAENPEFYGMAPVAETSGYICFDGKTIKVAGGKRVMLMACDAKTHKLLCYVYSAKEDSKACRKLLSLLKEMFHDKIRGFTTDFGKGRCFVTPINDVFPGVAHQICLVHYRRYLNYQLPKSRRSKYFWRNKIFRNTVKTIINAPTKNEAKQLLARLLKVKRFFRASYHKRFYSSLQKHLDLLLAYRDDTELPSNSNAIEAQNRSLKRKLQNMDGFKSDESAKAFLKLWFCSKL